MGQRETAAAGECQGAGFGQLGLSGGSLLSRECAHLRKRVTTIPRRESRCFGSMAKTRSASQTTSTAEKTKYKTQSMIQAACQKAEELELPWW